MLGKKIGRLRGEPNRSDVYTLMKFLPSSGDRLSKSTQVSTDFHECFVGKVQSIFWERGVTVR